MGSAPLCMSVTVTVALTRAYGEPKRTYYSLKTHSKIGDWLCLIQHQHTIPILEPTKN